MHDQLFNEQDDITAENIKVKLSQFARATKGLDLASYQACLDNEMSLGLVFRDMNLASLNDESATPTLFINGHRLQGVKDAVQLRELIAEAAKDTP
jgi:protein-disulfide isomerase